MQIKADVTREKLMESNDVLFEACHPIGKLKAIANLLYAYPDGDSEMHKDTITSVSDMITDAVKEIEYLIEISNEQRHQDQEKWKADCILQAMNS